MGDLNAKINEAFPGLVVRKDLVKQHHLDILESIVRIVYIFLINI